LRDAAECWKMVGSKGGDKTVKGRMRGKGSDEGENANILRTSGRSNTQIEAVERGCEELQIEPKIEQNGGRTRPG
jgi:hypothetical protein